MAADLVKVTYKDVKTPILTISDAIRAGSFFPSPGPDLIQGNAEGGLLKVWNREYYML